MDQQIAYLEQERQRVEREKLKALDAQRDATQKRTMAREYDLNDPLAKLNDLPGRVGDDDPRLSVSGMQIFHGEDLGYAARKQLQAQDQRAWNMEMAGMKAEAAAKAKAEAAEFAARGMEIDAIKQGLEAATIAQKKRWRRRSPSTSCRNSTPSASASAASRCSRSRTRSRRSSKPSR